MMKMKNTFSFLIVLVISGFYGCSDEAAITGDYPIQPVSFNKVHLEDDFWAPRIDLNHKLTIPYAFDQSEQTGRIKNFDIAAGKMGGSFCSIYPFDDSDVYKIIEGASYSLQSRPDPEMEAYLDDLIARIGDAQEPDGYLYTNRTIMGDSAHPWAGSRRWELVHDLSHELYNLGHMYEAGVAHYLATGKTSFLDICTKSADLLVRDFGWGKEENYPGHQEIEIGLAKLYRVTGTREYLDLAKFFLDVRGPDGTEYNQSHKKVIEQDEAVGHAVRANYMYSGMADVAALTGDREYMEAIDRIWNNVVNKKIYITGGVGSTSSGEAYGDNYYLPNMSAYNETCAAIANVFWNQRMFLLHGDARYINVLERSLYNGVLSGLGMSGDRFFYPNPLKSRGQHQRSAWFGCACCPSNLTRFIPSIPGYVYAVKDDDLYINLYISNKAEMTVAGELISVDQSSGMPWDGQTILTVNPESPVKFSLMARLPGWTGDEVVPGDLYNFADPVSGMPEISVNGKTVGYKSENGYAVIKRKWEKGDRVEIDFPMDVRRVKANGKVEADIGQVALQRGPLVYCLEWPDQEDNLALNLMLSDKPEFSYEFNSGLLNGVGVITAGGYSLKARTDGTIEKEPTGIMAIPYYSWAHRGPGEMTVWIPESEEYASPLPAPTIASTSKVTSSECSGALSTVNDQLVPKKSYSKEFGHIHWWPKKNTTEWVQYDFAEEEEVSGVKVFWFDDEDINAGCRVPESWKLMYKTSGGWEEVDARNEYGTAKDTFNELEFAPVKTTALKLIIVQQKDWSTGVQEWAVN
jgi:DUF1680 family protein